jgi:pantoate--beta-alanine ligase
LANFAWSDLQREAIDTLVAQGWKPDYVSVRQQGDLCEPHADAPIVVLAAATLGSTRLIDNIEMDSL